MNTKKENKCLIFCFISRIKKSPIWMEGVLNKLTILVFLGGFALALGCNQEGRGLALPPGDREEGKATFSRLGCDECHSAGNIEWKGSSGEIHFALGGDVTLVKTYGELVTAIINPSHKVSKRYQQLTNTEDGISIMKMYNDVMTVQELVDLVTFLQKEYKLKIPETNYPPF